MEKQLFKSIVISDTHQLVLADDYRLVRAIGHADELLRKYGRRKPLQFAACCVCFLVYLGKGGYKCGHTEVVSAFTLSDYDGNLSVESYKKGMRQLGHSSEGAMVIPGFNLEHYQYESLSFMKMRKETPLEKLAKEYAKPDSDQQLSKRKPETPSSASSEKDGFEELRQSYEKFKLEFVPLKKS